MLYQDLYQEFLTLSVEEKRQKLELILAEFQGEGFYAETIALVQDSNVNENYLNSLYEVIMKPLSQQTEKSDQVAQIQMALNSLQLEIKTQEDNTEELDNLLNNMD